MTLSGKSVESKQNWSHFSKQKTFYRHSLTASVFQNRKQWRQSYFSQEKLEETKQPWNTSCRGDAWKLQTQLSSPSRPHSCHRRHPCLPAALAKLRPGPEHRDGGGIPEHHAEPVVTARRGDHPQEGGPADEKQVGASASRKTHLHFRVLCVIFFTFLKVLEFAKPPDDKKYAAR